MKKNINSNSFNKLKILITLGIITIHFFIFHSNFIKAFPKLELEYTFLFYGLASLLLISFNRFLIFSSIALPYICSVISYWALSIIGYFKYHMHSTFSVFWDFILVSLFYPYIASGAWALTILLIIGYLLFGLYISKK